jgi:hypothetical protein
VTVELLIATEHRLDDAAGVHDGHPVRDPGHHTEVVGDEHGAERILLAAVRPHAVAGDPTPSGRWPGCVLGTRWPASLDPARLLAAR